MAPAAAKQKPVLRNASAHCAGQAKVKDTMGYFRRELSGIRRSATLAHYDKAVDPKAPSLLPVDHIIGVSNTGDPATCCMQDFSQADADQGLSTPMTFIETC